VSGLKRAEFPFSIHGLPGYRHGMTFVRILVDGYSLLHDWRELAPRKPRHSAAAREELIRVLTHYQDVTGTPITIFFDGNGAPRTPLKSDSAHHVEVLYSKAGQTADDLIERAAHRFQAYGQVMAVTDDSAERDVVTGLGGHACGCRNFIRMVEDAMHNLHYDLKRHNRAEQHRYRNS
jgi:predicted RNA-binding protein with PIN domain